MSLKRFYLTFYILDHVYEYSENTKLTTAIIVSVGDSAMLINPVATIIFVRQFRKAFIMFLFCQKKNLQSSLLVKSKKSKTKL